MLKSLKCLAAVPGTIQVVTSVCDENDLYQKWQWVWNILRNIGLGKCIKYYPSDPLLRMSSCNNLQVRQRIACSFNTLRIREKTMIGAKDDGTVTCYDGSGIETRWRTSSGDGVDSICNVTNNRGT